LRCDLDNKKGVVGISASSTAYRLLSRSYGGSLFPND
jgi:hypothetical protein